MTVTETTTPQGNATAAGEFPERRGSSTGAPGVERRQFTSSRDNARPEVNELATAIDEYKVRHRRRFITVEELFDVMCSLGYHR